jgi:hypothetical protein
MERLEPGLRGRHFVLGREDHLLDHHRELRGRHRPTHPTFDEAVSLASQGELLQALGVAIGGGRSGLHLRSRRELNPQEISDPAP